MPVNFSKIQIPFIADNEIRQRTDEFRRQYWGEEIPVDIELIVERNLRLLIIPVADLLSEAHTEAYLSGDLCEIVYDPARPDPRIRFSIAHEDWRRTQLDLPEALWGRAEYQAREFAGRLLVPPEKLKEELQRLKPLIDKARRAIPDLEIQVIKENVASKLARRFFVSADVIGRRMDAEQISPIQ